MESLLDKGLKSLGISCSLEQQTALLSFVNLLLKWNKVYNLTAVRDAEQMVKLHFQ